MNETLPNRPPRKWWHPSIGLGYEGLQFLLLWNIVSFEAMKDVFRNDQSSIATKLTISKNKISKISKTYNTQSKNNLSTNLRISYCLKICFSSEFIWFRNTPLRHHFKIVFQRNKVWSRLPKKLSSIAKWLYNQIVSLLVLRKRNIIN